MRRPGEALSRFDLLEHAWDDAYENRSNVVDVYVRLPARQDRPAVRDRLDRDGARRRLPAAARHEAAADPLRVTLAFAAALAVVLAAVGAFVYLRFETS